MLRTHVTSRAASDRPLRIVIVTESFLPQVNGVTNSVCRIVEELRLRDYDIDIIAPTGPDSYEGATVHRVNSVNLPGYNGFNIGMARQGHLRDLIARLAPDVLHVASPIMLGSRAISAANSLNIPVVSIYQTDLVGLADRYRLGSAKGLIARMVRRIHNASELTLAPSSASMEQLAALGIERVKFWPRGIDTQRFDPAKANANLHEKLTRPAHRAHMTSRPVLVGYVGRLAKEKDLHHLASLQHVPNIQLVIVGDGPEREQLRQLLPKATFLGSLQGEDLSELIASLDIFIHPGADETFCQAVQEALASGVPAVGPAAGGLRDRIQDGRNGLHYSPNSVAGLRAAVEMLAGDKVLREQFGATARKAVLELSWESITQRLIDYYLHALAVHDQKTRTSSQRVAKSQQGVVV